VALEFHPAAQEELWRAITYYESAAPGLGAEFLEAIEQAAELLNAHPEAGEKFEASRLAVRKWPLGRFPYVIFYTTNGRLLVLAVAHTSRNPTYWLS
jgi:plasmid stabilization system protein ParE